MTNATETVHAFMLALETGEYDSAALYLTGDFLFSGWTPQPLGKDEFITIIADLKAGIHNLTFNFHNQGNAEERMQQSKVKGTTQISGTQTEGFILPPLGLPPIPQTAQSFSLPQEHWHYTLQDNKITRIVVEHTPGGGIQGLLHQLGIDVPIVQ